MLWQRMIALMRARDLSVVTLGVFLRTLAAFAFAKFTAACLGPVEYATYGHYYMVATYLVTASSLGLGNAFTVYIARSKGPAGSSASIQAVNAAGLLTGIIAGVGLIALFFLDTRGVLLPHIRGWHLSWWFLFCIVAAVGTTIQASLLGVQGHVRYQVVTALNPAVSCVVLFAVIMLVPANPTLAIVAYMAGFLVPIAAIPSMTAGIFRVRWSALKELATFARPYLIPTLMIPTIGTVSILSVRYVVSTRVNTYDLGIWQALWRLSEGYMGALISVGTALFLPRFPKLGTRREARNGIAKAAILLLLMYTPLALSFLVIPKLMLKLLLSSQFGSIASLLPVQIAGDALKILCFLVELFFTCMVAPRLALLGEILFSGLFLGLTPVIMSRFHTPMGAVWSYTLSYALVLCVLLPLLWRQIKRLPVAHSA